MTTTPKTDESAFDVLRKFAIEARLTDAAKGANILIKKGAMPDLVTRAFAELTTDSDGFLVSRSGGKHTPALDWLHITRKAAPYYFETGAGVSSGGPGKTLPSGPKVIKASEMGAHLQEIADGKVVVEATSDGTG